MQNADKDRIKKLEDEVRSINERITTITGKLDEQARDFEDYSKDNTLILASAVEAMSIIRYYDSSSGQTTLSDLDGVFSCLKRLDEIRQATRFPSLSEFTLERERIVSGALLVLAKNKNIGANKLFARGLEEFGKENFMFCMEDVASVFGTEEAVRWQQLLE
jgi:hypothetical protein